MFADFLLKKDIKLSFNTLFKKYKNAALKNWDNYNLPTSNTFDSSIKSSEKSKNKFGNS